MGRQKDYYSLETPVNRFITGVSVFIGNERSILQLHNPVKNCMVQSNGLRRNISQGTDVGNIGFSSSIIHDITRKGWEFEEISAPRGKAENPQ